MAKKYFKENFHIFLFLLIVILLMGPILSVVLSFVSRYLNPKLGDWLSFYGSIFGIVISVLVIHFQISREKYKDLLKYRPEFILSYDYQLIKPNCKIYFDDKHWYHLVKNNQRNKHVEANDFEKTYALNNKRDKILSIEIVNVQPVFNLHIIFGEEHSCEIIPKLDVGRRIYVVSKTHQNEIQAYLLEGKADFKHVPQKVTIYYTTLAGGINSEIYQIGSKGYCRIAKKNYGISYPKTLEGSRLCDYFLSK
ncbi:hypothetical protein [Streptococcus intermedius]|uniref:hypothetical protein n=1 Tax=Streptococcus intermedius TaxID=1338 RepID=UPI00124E361A|nr:hypothetical protein [Streptococcus intermedius]